MINEEMKVACITGAINGAGPYIAHQLCMKGYHVILIDERSLILDRIIHGLRDLGFSITAFCCSLSDKEAVESLFQDIRLKFNKIHLLIHNTWYAEPIQFRGEAFFVMPIEKYHIDYEKTVRSHTFINYFSLPLLENCDKPVVIHMTKKTDSGFLGNFYYDLTKATINRVASNLSHDLLPLGITVIGLDAGFIRTNSILRLHNTTEEDYMEVLPLRNSISPYKVAEYIISLFESDEAYRSNGKIIDIKDLQ